MDAGSDANIVNLASRDAKRIRQMRYQNILILLRAELLGALVANLMKRNLFLSRVCDYNCIGTVFLASAKDFRISCNVVFEHDWRIVSLRLEEEAEQCRSNNSATSAWRIYTNYFCLIETLKRSLSRSQLCQIGGHTSINIS